MNVVHEAVSLVAQALQLMYTRPGRPGNGGYAIGEGQRFLYSPVRPNRL